MTVALFAVAACTSEPEPVPGPVCGETFLNALFESQYDAGDVAVDCASLPVEQIEMLFDPRSCNFNGTNLVVRTAVVGGITVLASDDWFAREGIVDARIHVGLQTARTELCRDDAGICVYNAYGEVEDGCEAEVLVAAAEAGDLVEFRTIRPCPLRGGLGITSPFPTLRSLHVRGRITDFGRSTCGMP